MPKKLSAQAREEVIAKALKGEPIDKLAEEAKVSKVLVYRWLKRYKSEGKEGLEEGRRGRPKLAKEKSQQEPMPRLSANDRLLLVHQVVNEGRKLTEVARTNHVSRISLYKWIKEYKSGRGLERKRRDPATYYGYTPELYEQAVLALVLKHPEYGIRQIVANLPKIGRTPIMGHHGVQRILERHELSTEPLRLAYAQSQQTQTVRAIGKTLDVGGKLFDLPEQVRIRLVRMGWLSGISAFGTVVGLGVINLMRTSLVQTGGNVGIVFAYIALLSGTFFFVYSFKYYLTIAMVLSFSQGLGNLKLGVGRTNRGGLWSWLMGPEEKRGKDATRVYDPNDPVGLQSDLSQVHLKRYPFVSVQVPFYNEKNVIERSIAAAIAMDYPEYEVVLADDSTDETTSIARTMMEGYGELKKIKGEGWEMTSVEIRKGLILKHLHRTTRQGYKGGALDVVMKLVDPRTEFTCIFDADFVPYPDSLIHFLKYFKMKNGMSEDYGGSKIAAVQGYQWHVLNKSENWITRGVRTEYAGSYVIERAGEELYGGLKQISGAVYMIRQEALRAVGWGVSITEDFELTLRLYAQGYKVVYTPYIQAPAECVSTLKRLVRQRMRWAEGHSQNIKKMFMRIMFNNQCSITEKAEFLYLVPYYLQAAFFLIGTLSWFISEAVLKARIPFWTEVWGWSLVLTNMFSLPLMNGVGMFLEESDERDYVGLASFVALAYIVVPFQAYAAIKGFINKEEGPWFRTPKTGMITDVFRRNMFIRFIRGILPGKQGVMPRVDLSFLSIPRKSYRRVGRLVVAGVVLVAMVVGTGSRYVPLAQSYTEPELQVKSVDQTGFDQKEVVRNATAKEITSARVIARTTKGGKPVEYSFDRDPRVSIKLEEKEIVFETKLLAGKKVNPKTTKMYEGREVVYEEIAPGVDLKYQVTNDLIVEEVVVKNREAGRAIGNALEQEVHIAGVQIVSPHAQAFGFYDKDGSEVFTLGQPFMSDAAGKKNYDLRFELDGHKLRKILGNEAKAWLDAPERKYPVSIDPSVVVTGGIADADVQLGGIQRKVAFVNNDWYAFYNDAGDVSYKKSADGVSWGSAVSVDEGDTDNYNPTISVSGSTIIVVWVDDSDNEPELNTIETTADLDTLGLQCNPTGTAVDATSRISSLVAKSATTAVLATSDSAGSETSGVGYFTGLGTSCSVTDSTTGNISFGSGMGNGDRPVVVPLAGNKIAMVFQDGNLSYSEYDTGLNEWTKNNLTIAAVTDTIYSAVSNGTDTVWILTVSGTTATNFYKCCTDDWAITQIDADAGANDQDGTSDVDMFCPTEDNCKIVYTDDIDTAAPILKFVDCNDATCSSPTITSLDTDIGAAGDQAGASIYCVTDGTSVGGNCKIAYGDGVDDGTATLVMIDCTNDEDCSTNGNSGGIDTDIGPSTVVVHTSIHCPADTDCKIVYDDSASNDVTLVDCSSATCNTRDAITDLDTNAGANPKTGIDCSPGAANCKVVWHDNSATGGCLDANSLCFKHCTNAACSTGTLTVIDSDIGTVTNQPPMAIDCSPGATDCKIVYGDVTAGDVFFVDCPDAACTATGRTITQIDATGGGAANVNYDVDLDCVAGDDCKFTYVGDVTAGSEKQYFVDCDNAVCSAGSVLGLPDGSDSDTVIPRFRTAISCLTSTNCKLAYYEGTASVNPTVQFADCDVTNCFPASTAPTAPWASETNVLSVSLTYDSSNSDLYAHVVKDASEQAYWNSTDATTISWNGSTSYGFTAGDINHISAPETSAGTTGIGVTLRQGSNYEFSATAIPENVLWLMIAIPAGVGYARRKKYGR